MIVVKLMGGLGNQMFQYATGLSLAKKHNTELLIDTSFLSKDSNDQYTKRNFELDCFNFDFKIANDNDLKPFVKLNNGKFRRYLQRNFPFLFSYVNISESGMAYNKQFENFPNNTYLNGFWQSDKYFKNISDVLYTIYSPKEKINEINKNWLNKIEATQSVSLHIRRGDYITNKNALSHHGICELDYYYSAISHIKEKQSNIEIFVFSDDLQWCKTHLEFTNSINFVDANEKENMHLDIFLMSICKHNIIANSSFSWWGAWLNQNPKKIVIAPQKWFANTALDTTDLIPKDWIKL